MRGIFFDEDDARSAVAALVSGGFEASLERVRFAGEDDDEDHPWAVTSDAPEIQLEMLVETYDGWLDREDGLDTSSPSGSGYATGLGLPLPDQPKRIKRP